MLTIVLATHNNHKLEEVKDILKNYPIQILSLSDLKIEEIDVKENKKKYKENALKKAKVYAKYTNYPIMSDDSGLEIESMNFAPGIKSSRYAKLHHGYNNAFKSIFKKIENQSRNAQFCCNIVLINFDKEPLYFEGICKGKIIDTLPNTIDEKSFGYDPIFVPFGYKNSFAKLSSKTKNKISHRARALKNMINYLDKHYHL